MAWTPEHDEQLSALLYEGHSIRSAAAVMGFANSTITAHRQELIAQGHVFPRLKPGTPPGTPRPMSNDPEVFASNGRRNKQAFAVGFNWLERNARDGRVWLGGERVPVGKAACDMLEELHRWAVAQRRAAYEVDARRARTGEVA